MNQIQCTIARGRRKSLKFFEFCSWAPWNLRDETIKADAITDRVSFFFIFLEKPDPLKLYRKGIFIKLILRSDASLPKDSSRSAMEVKMDRLIYRFSSIIRRRW